MDMYVRMFDDLKRGEDDNPTIGIILCHPCQLLCSQRERAALCLEIPPCTSHRKRTGGGTGSGNTND